MAGKKKKDKSLKYLIYGVIIIIAIFLILFIVGKILPQKDGGYYYNGFSFVKGKDMWFTQIQPPGKNKLYTIEIEQSLLNQAMIKANDLNCNNIIFYNENSINNEKNLKQIDKYENNLANSKKALLMKKINFLYLQNLY